ncbi:TolB domain-containing protein [Neobacillus bataviensis LMG 21833]|uniref:TolB domain-containing protein n=1 Tax=Neobacillus bataviensis LMG 21833 TaxID=1117379 RepID=K6DCL3_9BACI|nr:PD40 domain-containing protein [Neobacillus bataviensis]EKN66009.1 TolB domain-containing protein [Neobacillus bataviensis LMG 21833]
MKKQLCLLLIFLLLLPTGLANAEPVNVNSVKAAFVRDGFLWTKINGKEEKITKEPGKYDYPPQWSPDGKWIAYQVEAKKKLNLSMEAQTEIWVYNLEMKQHKQITLDGNNPRWSPVENILAFKSGGVLNVSNLENFYNIALGVGDYNWYPDGRSFITASSASLRPDGWTNPVLFQIGLEKDLSKITSLTKNVKKLFTIPSELKKGNISLLAIDVNKFQFSSDGKWISFVVSPTASWSMDSDFVCVISSDGQNFEVIDDMNGDSIVKWAFHKNRLGYIAGGGRIVFGFKDKDMKVTELPAFKSINLTPPKFAELGFAWLDDHSLVVSRVKESEWSNDAKKRPDPSLFLIKIGEQKQKQITHPPKDYGDYDPIYISSAKKLTWLRFTDLVDLQRDLWIADQNGENAKLWIKNVGGYDFYEEKLP